jgi:hypothetical protein
MVFEPPLRGDAGRHTDRFVFVRDGFGWGAFLLGPLWMIWRRLWLAFLGYILLVAALEGGFRLIGVSAGGRVLVGFLIALLLGFEAASLRRWTLARRRGWRELGIVVADDLEAAERRFFEAWVAGRTAHGAAHNPPPPPAVRMPASSGPDVIGLFPEPGASR